jgi:uncharacterized membrane protein YhaH (DUF805 family)
MQAAVWDVVLTIVIVVATFATLVISAFFDLVALAFTDYCPASCEAHLGAGVATILTILIGVGVLAVIGTIIAVIRLVRRRRAWWVALITLVVVILGAVAALWAYTAVLGA